MFQGARLKLTGWYLLIIMLISLAFSVVIYRVISLEVERFARTQQFRIEKRNQNQTFIRPLPEASDLIVNLNDLDLIEETEGRMLLILAIVNGGILVLAGGSAYFLAGRTLNPIKKMVEEQNRFVADASHELRTPLTALKSSMEVNLRDKNLTLGQARELISENIDDVNKLQSLSDYLLQLVQFDQNGMLEKSDNINLKVAAQKAIKKIDPVASQKSIKISLKAAQINLKGSAELLENLLVILLDNAVKYSKPKTKVMVQIVKKDGQAQIKVIDEGEGIDAKDQPFIFDRFYRGDKARAKNGRNGYGLGLSIAKKIVLGHGGSIEVDSNKNKKGSTFIVKLPIRSSKSRLVKYS